MEHFKSIINKGKKFAKPELKSCIEEFEDKISKFHIDKKEQELTARNAAAHQQKADAIKNITLDANIEEESAESEADEDGEVMDPTMDETSDTPTNENASEADDLEMSDAHENASEAVDSEKSDVSSNEDASKHADFEEHSHVSSQVIQSEACDDEVQSPLVIPKGTARHRGKKSSSTFEMAGSQAPSIRVTRSRRRS